MNVSKDPQFDSNFPERYPWQLIDSVKLSELAVELASMIVRESLYIPSERNLTPGLRYTLRKIAEKATV